jgi:TIR domain
MGTATPAPRRIIFISHATPQENDFATWLGSRLIVAGYETWVDQTRLLGAEIFWHDIDEAIRVHAAKVIVALSRSAVTKEGVLDEIAIAATTARKMGDPQFIVPVRVDDLPFDEVPPVLVRKNIIDFSAGWAYGFARVLKVLERDQMPKSASDAESLVQGFLRFHLRKADNAVEAPETLLSNWVTIRALPATVNFYDPNRGPDGPSDLLDAIRTPRQQFFRYIASFAERDDLQADLPPSIALDAAYRVPLNALIAGDPPDGPGIGAPAARNMVTNLLRQAWDFEMLRRGLRVHAMAHGSIWFVPAGLLDDDKAWFVDADGRRRWRKLVGRSERRGVWWHLGVSARPQLGPPRRMILRPHVVFSADGATPLESATRMQRLRKSFCRSWWNDKWRDLTLAFLGWLADEKPSFAISAGGAALIELSGQTMAFEAPITLSAPLEGAPETDEAEIEGAEVEEPEDFDADDEKDAPEEDDSA